MGCHVTSTVRWDDPALERPGGQKRVEGNPQMHCYDIPSQLESYFGWTKILHQLVTIGQMKHYK